MWYNRQCKVNRQCRESTNSGRASRDRLFGKLLTRAYGSSFSPYASDIAEVEACELSDGAGGSVFSLNDLSPER
eukprot:8924679-Pyramimonas_sp.AAC.1